ncbi:MAG: FHA domain-containing protein, partial [Lachnospiraceae bacterium]|nr:FHA domain-containing protein [Lachnospiraceae bacterium]
MEAVNNMNSGFGQEISYSTASLLILAADKPLSIKQVQSGRPLLLGRPTKDSHPDVEIESRICGRRHAQLSCVNGQWIYTDLGSINGSYVNGALYKSEAGQVPAQVTLNSGDVIRIDTTDLAHPDVDNGVWILFTIDQKRGGWFQKELKKDEEVTIGRVSDNVISLNSAFITRHHAKVSWNGTSYVLQDLGSRAGTWYNGTELTGPVVLKNRDTFCICDRTFVFLNNKLFFSNYESAAAPSATVASNSIDGGLIDNGTVAITGSA